MTQNDSWKAVTLAAGQVIGLGTLYAWSVLIEPVQAYYGVERTATGLVFSISMAVFTFAVMTAPRLFAGRRLSMVGAVACIIGAVGLACAAIAPSFVVFLIAYGALFAAASGFGYSAGLQMAVTSGVAQPGLATGVIVAAFAMGAVVLGPLMGQISASGTITGALFLPAGVLFAASVMSLGAQRACPSLDARFPARGAASDAHQHRAKTIDNRLIWLLWCGFATGAAGGLMVLGHASSIVADQGGSVALGGVAVSMIAMGNALGRITSGAIADRLGPRAVLLLAALVLGLATGVMALEIGTATSVFALAVVGLSYGLMATGYPVAVHRFYGAERFGSIYGRVFTAWGIAGLIAPFAAGWLFDRTGSYHLALQLATVSAVLSALIALLFPGVQAKSQLGIESDRGRDCR